MKQSKKVWYAPNKLEAYDIYPALSGVKYKLDPSLISDDDKFIILSVITDFNKILLASTR